MMLDMVENHVSYLTAHIKKIYGVFLFEFHSTVKVEPIIKGYPNVFPDVEINYWNEKGQINVVIEIKPTIQNCGAVMRQMRIYMERYKSPSGGENHFILFTKETKYDKLFEDQGILVVHPREEEVFE